MDNHRSRALVNLKDISKTNNTALRHDGCERRRRVPVSQTPGMTDGGQFMASDLAMNCCDRCGIPIDYDVYMSCLKQDHFHSTKKNEKNRRYWFGLIPDPRAVGTPRGFDSTNVVHLDCLAPRRTTEKVRVA